MLIDSLKKRYAYKLISNSITLVINIVVQVIVQRGLGPKAFGDFSYLTSFFQQVVGFFDIWTTPSFFIKLSQRPKEFEIVIFTLYVVGICSTLLFSSFLFISPGSSFYNIIWSGQEMYYLFLAAIWSIMVWILQLFTSMSDAFGLTVKSEKGRVVQKIIGLFLILLLFLINKLNITSYFYFHYITMFFLIGYYYWMIKKNGIPILKIWRIPIRTVENYAREFFEYSHPLFFIGFIGFSTGLFDRWLLQSFSGSVEQGFYGFSYQIGAVCFLFSGTMSPLIMREFSVAHSQIKHEQLVIIFRKYIPLLFSIVAFISCYISVQSDKVVLLIGGLEYSDAAWSVAVMSFYPIHQTYGQLSGSVFLATGQTKIYSKIGVFSALIGIPLTLILVSSPFQLGFNFGAAGLAIKMVLIQIISVNVQLYYNAKFLNLNFRKYITHQVIVILCLTILSYTSVFISDNIFLLGENTLLSFLLSGIFYSLMVLVVIFLKPEIFAMSQKEISYIILFLKNSMSKKVNSR